MEVNSLWLYHVISKKNLESCTSGEEVAASKPQMAGTKGGRAEIHWQDFRGLFARWGPRIINHMDRCDMDPSERLG